MKRSIDMKTTFKLTLLASALALAASPAAAEVYDLCAGATTKSLPDGSSVPMWGYGLDTGGLCVATIPGPPLTMTDGTGNLTINLRNTLTEPTSVVIPGLPMPTGGSGPTWDDGTTGGRTSISQRVRSFGAEAAAAATQSYSWTGVRPGSFIYHSGTHPQKQLYMGLYGAVTQNFAEVNGDPAEAYEGVAYDNEVVLFYSEIDPELNAAIDGGLYSTSIDYHPQWFLINGEPYEEGMAAINAGAAGDTTLVRFFSAASETHVPTLQGLRMTIHAEDAIRYNWQDSAGSETLAPRDQYSVALNALKTKDATIVPTSDGTFAVYDGNGYMTNPSDPGNVSVGDTVGGMLRFLLVGSGVADSDGDSVPDTSDLCPGTLPADVPFVDGDGCAPSQFDIDGDGVPAGQDSDDTDPLVCADTDADTCDDCSQGGGSAPSNDGLDSDSDGLCDAGDPDDDNDGVPDAQDSAPNDPLVCADTDADTCDDCSQGGGSAPSSDGLDTDSDGLCDAGDTDDDNDGISDASDLCPGTPLGTTVGTDGCPVSTASVANGDAYSVNEDAILNVSAACGAPPEGLLCNDVGDSLTVTAFDSESTGGGAVSVNGDGSFVYNSAPDWNSDLSGLDTFTYTVNGTATATVSINVAEQNDAPIAFDDQFFLNKMGVQGAESFAAPGVLVNDNDVDLIPFDPAQLTAVLDTDANRGTLNLNADGSFDYTAGTNDVRVGTVATFEYHNNDGLANSNTVTATLTRELSVKTATCELDTEVNKCAWVIEGRSVHPGGSTIEAYLNGALLGTTNKGNGPGWGIDVQGSTIVPTAGDTVTVKVLGHSNGLITGFTVDIQ
jgi:hypothetical protein